MSLYQPGDIVRVVKPENTREFPSWSSSMDPYEGQDFIVESVRSAGPNGKLIVYVLEHIPYWWRESWLVPVENDSDEFSIADDSDIHNLLSL